MTAEPVTLLGSEQHLMTSRQNGRTYRITVSLPLGYDAPAGEDWPFHSTPEKWPVVYVLDGNWYSGLVTEIIRPMAWCGSTTDAIVVGIGYPEGDDPIESFRVSFTRRDHDLTPVRDDAVTRSMEQAHKRPVPNGDAGGFHKFIEDELIPFVERSYRADPSNRILLGHSYGGLFALFGMLETPGLFQTLIVGSPTLSYGERYAFRQEEAFAETHRALPVRVFLFVGELEESMDDQTMTDTLRLAAILQGRGYEGFSLVKHIFPDQNHCEVAAAGFQAGLKFALRR
ncbi:MAG TPA: alpha/beta hydrolase-fold protein [Aggregatilinea sp.]|uniref:alpha/beta hydrolase n=1 Tax=Aggregatilinea sp. TaxID=2806333 RepID=UPI002CA6491D|nr:alpha/beta hydrolase-fold protein [Aggregatilinea sp.]HML24821.1 alpha/beta hydrolase-fold protein [Aggregatilinea sp.]